MELYEIFLFDNIFIIVFTKIPTNDSLKNGLKDR